MPNEILSKIKSDYADHYNRLSDLTSVYESLDYSDLIEVLPADHNLTILDLGCGQGQVLYHLHKSGYVNVTGVDQSSSQLDIAKKHLPDSVHLHLEDAETFLTSKSGQYDVIILFDVIEHITKERIPGFLEAIVGALTDGGVMVVRTPNMASPLGVYSLHINFTHEIGFTESSLRQLLQAAGFEEIVFHPFRWKSLKGKIATALYHWALRLLYRIENRSIPKMLDKNLTLVAKKKTSGDSTGQTKNRDS